MATSQPDVSHLRNVLELFKSGSRLPVRPMEELIAADASAELLLVDVLRSRALRDDSWAPLWSAIILGERRALRCIDDLLAATLQGMSIVHEAVEFALLRMGPAVVEPVLKFLDENPGTDGRINLYGVLAHYHTPRALDYLIGQLRRDEDAAGSVAWALAETRQPAALAALRKALERRENPEIREALEAAARRPQELTNPLLEDWRKHWTWEDEDETAADEGEGPDELAWGKPENDLELTPRYYDLSCPVCSSRLEYDTHEDDVNVLKCGRVHRERRSGRKVEE